MRAYRALLRLYPATFRREYEDEMLAVFVARRRGTSGFVGVLALWLETIPEIIMSALAVHWDTLRQDLRYTLRTLARAPGFAITALLVTALGVGANTAAFSIADFVLVRPLPFRDADRLVKLYERPPGYGRMELSPPDYHDWKGMSRSFAAMGAYHGQAMNLMVTTEPQRTQGAAVTADLLPLFGVKPVLGRFFTEAEEREGADGMAIISHALWQSSFGGDSAVIGRRVLTDGAARTIVGVMPGQFHFPDRSVDLWVPMPLAQQRDTDRTNNWFEVVARLQPGVTVAQARSEMSMIAARLERQYPRELEKVGANVVPLRDELSQQSRLMLLALCAAAVCVLLVACANLANLLLARSLARRRELVVRTALGAGRDRLVRQLVTESSVLALAGGGLGVAIALSAIPLLSRLVPSDLPISQLPSVDGRVLVIAGLLTAVTALGFGVLPAFQASGGMDLTALRDEARAGGGRRARVRSLLVVAEVMASVVLLVSCGLLLRALVRLQGVDPGFRTEGVLTMRTALPNPRYDSVATRDRFYTQVLGSVRALPGVSSAAYVSGLPMSMRGGIWPVVLRGQGQVRAAGNTASLRYSTPGYFATLRIPLKRGRDIGDADDSTHLFVAVVSESFAARYWPTADPIGQRFTFAFSERTIVGVVGDIRVRGPEQSSEPQVYVPYKQVADGSIIGYSPKDLVIRSALPPAAILPAVRRIVHEADPQQPISNVRTMDDIVAGETATRGVQLRVLTLFALVAFLLASIGIHGVLAFSVSQRRHEIGVRMALGADQRLIVRMVMRQAVLLAAAGAIPGVLVAYWAGRGMEALLAGVQPGDPTTFTVSVALCAAMTIAGSLIPVLRAVRVTPAEAFRIGG